MKTIKLKVIFTELTKKDGSKFMVTKTILKNDNYKNSEQWVEIKFGDAVNTKIWKNKNQLVTAEIKNMPDGKPNVKIPKSFEPFVNKDGKTVYPFIKIEDILDAKPLEYKHKDEDNSFYQDASQVEFSLDEEDTDKLSKEMAQN